MDIRELLEISKHNLHYGTEAETQMYSDRVMEVAGLLKKNPDFVGIKGSKQKITAPLAQGSKAFNATDGRFNIQQTAFPKQYVPKDIYDAAVKFNEEYDKAVVESEKAEREQKRKNLLIAFNAKNGIIMADDPRLNELLDPNDPLLGTVGQAIKDFGAAPKAESEEELGAFDAAKKQKILDDIIGFKKFQSETPGFKKQPSDVIEDISKPKQLDGQTFYNKYALNQHLKDKELQSITEKAAQEISKKHWLAGDISEFASKRISDEEAKIKKLNADIHNIVNGHKVVSVGDENYKYSKLTDDEKMLYNYFVMEQTPDMKTSLAGRYLKSLELGLEQRVAVDKAESMNGFEKGIYLFGHGIGGSLENIANIGGDFGYDPTEGELLASAIIEGEEDGFAKFVYQSISTISEQIPALAVGFATGGAGYSAVLSANIMSQSIKEAMQNNKTLIQGVSYGAVQASMELALERMLGGIGGKFLGKGSSSVVVKTLNKIDDIFTSRIPKALLKGAVVRLENGFGEFTQEFIQGITDPAIKNIIYQENNTYSLGTLNEALYQGLLGAISGMFLGGGANAAQTTAYYETLGDTLSDSQVLDFAKEAGNVKSDLYRELSEKARKGKELTAVERGMLSKETTDLVYNNATFTKETLKFMATEGSVKQISDVLFDGNTEAAEIFKAKFSDSEYVDSLMFGENEAVDASFVEKALNPTVPETAATEAMAEGQTVPTAEGEANAEVETVATDSIAHPAPTAGKVLKMTPVSAKAKNYVKDIAKRLGINLEFVDMAAELAKRGQNIEGLVIYPEGFYDPKTHTLYVGDEVANPVEFVFKHELTHYGERSKYYAEFARAVRDSKAFKKWLDTQATYTTKDAAGKELQLHLILKERYKGVKNLTEPESQREVIANFVADVLFKGDVDTLSEILNEATPTQKNAVMRFLSDFFSWLKSKFTGSKQITSEIADLENMFRELIGDAVVNPMPTESGITYDTASEGAVNEKTTEEVGVELDEKTESVSPLSFSLASWERSDYVTNKDKASAELAEALGISNKKAKAYIDSINGIAKVIADSRIRLDYVSSKGRSSFVSNAEYGGSIDFSTLCKKRGILTGTFSAIQKALRHSALTAEEILDIRNRLKEKGLEVSCGLCYVEGSRAQMGKFSKEFIERYKKRNPEYVPDMFDVNTPEGVEQLRIDHPEVYEAYEQFWNNKGVLNPGDSVLFASQQKPKLYQMRTEYNNEILEKFKSDGNVNEKNKNGGLRLQSFSDFEIVHLIDTMQVILDMSKVGLAGQAYTKVADFALALGNTGLKINLSLIAKGVDADGNLVFDDVEGMPIDTAMRIRDMYSDNVGTILVIFNDAQLKAALADNRVDFIIPFHRSQWKKALYEKLGLPKGTKDYTYQQNERYIKPVYYTTKNNTIGKRKATNYMPNEYWDFSKSGKENAEAYLKMCAENNKRPKFYKLLVDNKDGSYSLQPDGSTDGYWKLLIDFKMYNNEGVGVPQQPVKPDFNMEESMRMLEEYKGGHEQFPVDQETVDEFVSEYREKHKMDDFTEQKAEPKTVKTVYDNLSLSVPASEGEAVTPKSLFDKVQKGEITYEEFERLVNEGWSEAGKTYGVKPDGEMVTENNKPANVPNKVAPGKTVRRFVRNVLEANYSKDFNNALKSETLAKNKGTVYEVQSNKDLAERARKKIARQNIGTAQENWLKDTDHINPEKIAIGESLLVLAEQEGRIEDGVQLASELAIMFTTAGQVVQAASLFKRLGSIGKLIYLQKVVNKLNRDIARRYKNADPLVLNETLAAQLLETKTEEEAELVLDAIKADLGQQMPSNWLDKWNAWRYMSMLVNPTTHIRNVFGNFMFMPAIYMSEALSATIQSGVGAAQRARGKDFEKTTTFKANKRDKDFATKDWVKNRKKVMSSGKYEDVSDIEDNRRIYKNGILEGIRKGNSNLLEWEDGIFLKNHYIRTLARYLTANKINPETASEAQLDRARKYAIKKAKEYTYRDASKVANWLSKTAKDFKGADFLINGIIPFKKTPINILKRGIEYSPLGFIKALTTDFSKLKKGVENGGISLGEWIDGLASATTGTGLFIIGAFLSNLGVLKGDFDDDDKWFEKLRGHQEYSIELFGVNYTINWAAPSSIPMFMGAAFSNFQSDEDGNWFDNLLSMGASGLEPVLELTMLQGVNDALDAVSYAEDNEKLWTLGGNILTSYATQGLPTIGGKIANVIDNKRRTKYIDPSKGSVTLQTMWDTFSKKVPLLSMTRAEYIDAWGREEHTGNVVERFFSQFVSPGYASTVDPDPIYDELKAIKESTGEAGVYPEAPRKYITVSGDRRDLTKEEYYNVATMSGQTKMNLVNEAMDNKHYDKLTDNQKAEVIMNVYKYSNKLAVASELDFTLDEIKAGLGDKKGSVLTESRWNGFSFEQQQYLIHEAFMDGVITAYKYEQNGGSAAEYFILKALRDR